MPVSIARATPYGLNPAPKGSARLSTPNTAFSAGNLPNSRSSASWTELTVDADKQSFKRKQPRVCRFSPNSRLRDCIGFSFRSASESVCELMEIIESAVFCGRTLRLNERQSLSGFIRNEPAQQRHDDPKEPRMSLPPWKRT